MFNFQRNTSNGLFLALCVLLTSCSIQKQIARSAKEEVLSNKALTTAHVGISIYDPAAGKYLYNYQGDKYFVPASNTKIPTCYAAMKYLGDSLVGARVEERWNGISIYGTGDPTFLHPDFKFQPVFEYAKSKKGSNVSFVENEPNDYNKIGVFKFYGRGWNWDDYGQDYMPERSFFPIYGNLVKFFFDKHQNLIVSPPYFTKFITYNKNDTSRLTVQREKTANQFYVKGNSSKSNPVFIPFKTVESFYVDTFITNQIAALLSDTLGFKVQQATTNQQYKGYRAIHSQPTDSLLKPMMHRSDNFFAEQSLMMVSVEKLGYMFDEDIIDTLLKTDFKDLPQKPRWADGSGLSRYNLFTPQDFVAILNKMKNEFGMERIKVILPTGGEGTISNYYKADSGYIYAKTGTLSGVVAFSGFLYTKKGKLLIFSTLVNNHQATSTEVRRAVEKFLQGIRDKY